MSEEIKVATEEKAAKPAKPAPGILARKLGMTQIYNAQGEVVPVTVVEAGPCTVLQKKTVQTDGYNSIQVGFMKSKKTNKPEAGHAKKSGKEGGYRFIREFRLKGEAEFEPGEEIRVDSFKGGQIVDISGTSIGKGFAGTVKRHHFGRGPMTHGSKNHRLPGSIGAGSTPGRVLKGTRMSGRMGGELVTVPKVKIAEVDLEKNLILLQGTVPGKKNNFVIIRSRG
jgi:large subunit ribosomal protein L3